MHLLDAPALPRPAGGSVVTSERRLRPASPHEPPGQLRAHSRVLPLWRPRVRIAGVDVDNVTMQEAVERIEDLIFDRKPSIVVTPNADHIVQLQSNPALRDAYDSAALVLADGMSLILAARLLNTPLKSKVSGSDLLPAFAPVAARRGYRLFFLGGRPGMAQKSIEVLTQRYPGLRASQYCPPMGFEKNEPENRKAIQAIRESGADVLFVGLGSPKQETWIHRHCRDYRVPVSIGVGGTFEFISGCVRRAPRILQRTGLEWLWRLAMEPGRMYHRYLVQDPVFFSLLWQQCRDRYRGGSLRLLVPAADNAGQAGDRRAEVA